MSRKIVLSLAMSLDGCICEKDGGFEWILGHGDLSQNTENQYNMTKFIERCDTVVMGRIAYDDCGIINIEGYEDKRFIIATSDTRDDIDNIEFVSEDIVRYISSLRRKKGSDIWIFGGAGLANAFIKANIIDEYVIGIVPTILGEGIKLFDSIYDRIDLHLEESSVNNGIPILVYSKR